MGEKLVYCFDIDGVICDSPGSNYRESQPRSDVIERINKLYSDGHIIKIFTSRGQSSGIDWTDFTVNQLQSWGLKYHELIMGKPHADIFVDDKSINFRDWLRQ